MFPIVSVLPSRALMDEKLEVAVRNLPPGTPVTLHSLHHSEDKDYWEAYGHYVSDDRGTVTGGYDCMVVIRQLFYISRSPLNFDSV